MVKLKKILAFIIIFTFSMSLIPGQLGFQKNKAYADSGNLVVSIATQDNDYLLTSSSVTLEWKNVTGAVSYVLTYRDHLGVEQSTPPIPAVEDTDIQQEITDLEKDFIYSFEVTAYMDDSTIKTYTKKVLTGITFEVPKEVDEGRLPQTQVELDGGGVEIGSQPGLRYMWKIPEIYDAGTVKQISEDDYDMLDYYINPGTDNSGTSYSQIRIRYSTVAGQYIATISTDDEVRTISEKVYVDDATIMPGYVVFDSYGPDVSVTNPLEIMTTNDAYPAVNVDPGFNSNADNMTDFPTNGGSYDFTSIDLRNVYYNTDIVPGTVYRMKIQPAFNDDYDTNKVAFLPSSVEDGYTYTPVRFQITKDSSNNLLLTVHKVNQNNSGGTNTTVNFTYEVKYATNDDFFGASLSARQTDAFSPGDTVVIYLENKNYDTLFYYKVDAWSPNEDQILSSNTIGYTISEDTSLPPLPEGVETVSVTSKTGTLINTFYTVSPYSGGEIITDVNSSDVKIRWEKPSNYDELMDDTVASYDPLYYHILLATSQSPEEGATEQVNYIFGDEANSQSYLNPNTNGGYREIFRVDLRACTLNGNYLEYEMDGLALFQDVSQDTNGDGNPEKAALLNDEGNPINEEDDYPTYFLPNKVYYLKLYSEKDDIEPDPPVSDTSIPISFTTSNNVIKTPASPVDFKELKNELISVDINSDTINEQVPQITLEWQKTSINLSDYTSNPTTPYTIDYELFMSDGRQINFDPNNPDDVANYQDSDVGLSENCTFVKIGSTDVAGDVEFDGFTSPASVIVDASLSSFTPASLPAIIFGEQLKRNTTYYFIVRTSLSVEGDPDLKVSEFTKFVAVTTHKGDIIEPGDEMLKPRAPVDFSVALDEGGNQKVSSTSATLQWTHLEEGAEYTLIRTALKINNEALIEEIDGNPENKYKIYFSNVGTTDATTDLVYDATTKVFTYLVSDLDPNVIYYFSLRTERTIINPDTAAEDVLESVWITIPVTSTLIEAPTLLEVVPGYEIGVSWQENSIYTADDMIISLNGSVIPKGQYRISENLSIGGNSWFYLRILSLQADSNYTVGIKGSTKDGFGNPYTFEKEIPYTTLDPITNSYRTVTREPMHEMDVKWQGKDGYTYEIAIRAENESEYTTLKLNAEYYLTSIEKPTNLVGTEFSLYYARIPLLSSNVKYYIKVRSSKNNSDTGAIDYSRYDGPVSYRTEFSQVDYDETDLSNKETGLYEDKVNRLEDSIVWVMENTTTSYKAKLRGDKAISEMQMNSGTLTLDLISQNSATLQKGAIYIPISIFEQMSQSRQNLRLNMPGSKVELRPDSINITTGAEITQLKNDSEIKEIYVYVELIKTSIQGTTIPTGKQALTGISTLNIQLAGMKEKTDAELETKIEEILSGYIANGLTALQESNADLKTTPQSLNSLIDSVLASTLIDFQYDISNYIENSNYGIKKTTKIITRLDKPMIISTWVTSSSQGTKSAYLNTASGWQSIYTTLSSDGIGATYQTVTPGKYIILAANLTQLYQVPQNHWVTKDLTTLTTKYDLQDVLTMDSSSGIDGQINISEAVLLFAKILNPGQARSSSVTATIAKEIGLPESINYYNPAKSIMREEMASLVAGVYSLKSGIDSNQVLNGKTIFLKDEAQVNTKYYRAVLFSITTKMMSVDANGDFRPKETCSWAAMITVCARLVTLLGE